MSTARVYFGLSEQLEFATLEGAIDSINSSNRWERLAALDLRTELTWARTQLCCSLLDQPAEPGVSIADRIAHGREKRAAEVVRQMAELRALPSIGLPPLQVVVRTLARLASNV
jgi:NAD-specific glutamate dehydrogenase